MPARPPRRGRHAAPRRRVRTVVLPGAVLLAAGGAALTAWSPSTASPAPASHQRVVAGASATGAAAAARADVTGVDVGVVLPARDHGEDAERASRSRRAELAPPPPPPPPPPPAPAFVRPMDGPQTSPFGVRWGRLHAGLDFGVPVGTPLRAVADAVLVVMPDDPRGYGTHVQLQLADGTVAVYGHLSQVLVPAGPVAAGQVIALSGDTGHSTGPHLHLELRGPTGPFDPRPWLEARGIVV